MATRKRVKAPNWRDIASQSAAQNRIGIGDPYAENVLDSSTTDRSKNFGPVNRTYRRANRALRPDPFRYLDDADSPDLRGAIQRSFRGDDRELLPFRPTNTSDPDRPRTRAAGWDPMSQELRIRFRNGSRYVYYGVPGYVWEEFKTSPSPGRYMNEAIVDVYEYEQETANITSD